MMKDYIMNNYLSKCIEKSDINSIDIIEEINRAGELGTKYEIYKVCIYNAITNFLEI